jgi:hypothetical protein
VRPTAAPKKKKADKTAARKPPARKPAKKVGPRADLDAPIDVFFAKQPAHLRPVLDELRKLVNEAAPDATSAMKWGLAFFSMGKHPMCALAGFKAHVNVILAGPPGTFADPAGILEGEGKTGRHLKLRALDDLPRAAVPRLAAHRRRASAEAEVAGVRATVIKHCVRGTRAACGEPGRAEGRGPVETR